MARRLTTISLRTAGGWRYHIPNENPVKCDRDGAYLWQAPHGGIYCNEIHEPEPHEHEFVPQMGDLDEEGEPLEACTFEGCEKWRTAAGVEI